MAEKQIFFVCGAPKSGTTWLQRVLDAHPEISCSGEGHFIERFAIPLSNVMRDYVAHMTLVATRVYEGEPYYPPIKPADFDRIVQSFVFDRLMSRHPGPEVRWIGDKTPRYTGVLPMLLRIFPDARFINIVRDPRDVALSRLHQAKRAKLEPIDAFTKAHPSRLHNLRYEDMVGDPAWEARRAFGFLGVSTESKLVADIVGRTSFEALSGRKPGEEHPTSFLRKGVAGDWREALEPEGQRALGEVCGPLMRQHDIIILLDRNIFG
jgi:hypothetical protein